VNFFGSKKLLGLDIGVSSIKLVEVELSRNNVTLTSFGFIPTPEGAITGGEIVDPAAVAQAITSLASQTKTKIRKACTAMWGSAVITKKISIPKIEEKLLPDQLKWEAEQYIPFDIKDINLQYQVLRNIPPPNPEQMNVLLIGAKRDYVLRYAEVVETAGLECSIIDVAGFALANCFLVNYPDYRNKSVVVLNFGAGVTNFVVIEKSEATFSRDISVGGNTYTTDIQKTMNVSIQEAEGLKISASTGQAVPQEVTDVINQTNEVVAEEIRRSFDFFLATSAEASIERVFVTGGGMGVPGLFDQIKTILNLPLENFNPFINVRASRSFTPEYLQQIAPYAGVGIGLAMRQEGK
jgi:type IV pilus assembly protein PilM